MTIPAAKVCGAEKGENTMTRDELEKRNVGENLDAIMCLDPRGYGVCRILYAGSRAYTGEPTAMHAAEALCKAIHPGDPVYILVGFVLLPHKVPEMDGSVSAILLARSLVLAFGAKPIIVCPEDSVQAVKNCAAVVGLHIYEDIADVLELPMSMGVQRFTKDVSRAGDEADALLAQGMPAAVISIVVAVVEMFTVSDTGPIGCIMNVLATCAFCCTAAFVYKKFHTRKGAVIGLALGTVCLTVVMLLWNYLITPIYMGMDREEIVVPMLIPVFLPFNLVKGGLNMALILLLYKPVVTALRKARLVPESHAPVEGKGKLSAGFLLFSLALLATFVVLALVLMGIL